MRTAEQMKRSEEGQKHIHAQEHHYYYNNSMEIIEKILKNNLATVNANLSFQTATKYTAMHAIRLN